LEKTKGASVRWISLLDSEFDDPSSTLEVCEEISKVSYLTVAPAGIFCPQRVMKVKMWQLECSHEGICWFSSVNDFDESDVVKMFWNWWLELIESVDDV